MNILSFALVQCQAAINSKYVITLQTSCSTWPEPEPFPPWGSVLYVIIIACGARGKRDLFLRHMQLQQRQQQKHQQQLPCCRCVVCRWCWLMGQAKAGSIYPDEPVYEIGSTWWNVMWGRLLHLANKTGYYVIHIQQNKLGCKQLMPNSSCGW